MNGLKFDQHVAAVARSDRKSNRRSMLIGAVMAAVTSSFGVRSKGIAAQTECQEGKTECNGSCSDLITNPPNSGDGGGQYVESLPTGLRTTQHVSGGEPAQHVDQRIAALEQRIAQLELERIPIDPSGPDWVFDYNAYQHDPFYQFGLACSIEEPATMGMSYRFICIRPVGLQ